LVSLSSPDHVLVGSHLDDVVVNSVEELEATLCCGMATSLNLLFPNLFEVKALPVWTLTIILVAGLKVKSWLV